MARPRRCRRICMEPEYFRFIPEGAAQTDTVVLTVDEYEVIRLVDLIKKNARRMCKTNEYFPDNCDRDLRKCQNETGRMSGLWTSAGDIRRQLYSV